MSFVPTEVDLAGVYCPPLLLAAILGLMAMVLTAYLLNRYRLSRFFMFPGLVMLAIASIYTVIIGTFVMPS